MPIGPIKLFRFCGPTLILFSERLLPNPPGDLSLAPMGVWPRPPNRRSPVKTLDLPLADADDNSAKTSTGFATKFAVNGATCFRNVLLTSK